MEEMMTLFQESAEFAFFLGTFLYAMCFAGDLLISRHEQPRNASTKG
jgi:hypothetical protein